jgi:hypothetical protein
MHMAFKVIERNGVRFALCLHTIHAVPQDQWDAVMEELRRGGGGAKTLLPRMLIVTDGGAPDAKQRGQLRELWDGQSVKCAAIVPGHGNPVKRGIMTALGWINPHLKFFTPDRVAEALAHVELDEELPNLWQDWLALQKQLPPNRALRLIAAEAQLPWSGPEPDMKLPSQYP